MRSVRISSISVPIVKLAGAFRRQLRVVVQDDRRGQHDLPPAIGVAEEPASRRCSRTRPRRPAQIGGSVIEMNSPPETLDLIMCAATCQRPGQRLFPVLRHGVGHAQVLHPDPEPHVRHGPAISVARTDTALAQRFPAADRILRYPGRPEGRRLPASGSRSSPPATAKSLTAALAEQVRARSTVNSISRSTASSQAAAGEPATVRRCTCRKRRIIWTARLRRSAQGRIRSA